MGEEAGPDRVAAAEGFAEPHGCAGQQVQRMPERRRLRRRPDEQFPVDLSRPGPRRAGRATGRAAPGRLAASGGPSTLAARSGRRCCGTRRRGPWRSGADRLGAVGPPRHQLGRQQDLGGRAVTAAGPPRGHGHSARPDAPHGAGTAGPERAQHTAAPRAGHPRRAGSARLARGSPRRSQRASRFMTASIAYRTPLAAEVGWCCTGPILAMRRHELADEARALRPADDHRPSQGVDQCSPARRRGDGADEPSNGTSVVRSVSDDDPSVHGNPRWGSTAGDRQSSSCGEQKVDGSAGAAAVVS